MTALLLGTKRIFEKFGKNEDVELENVKPQVLIKGWLHKRKRSKKVITSQWSRRWFTFENDVICWYFGERRDSRNNFPSGTIKLDDIHQVYKLNAITEKNDNIFVIKSTRRSLCLMTKTSGECDRWLRTIQMQLDLRAGGTVSGPKSSKNRRISNGGGDNFDVSFATSIKKVDYLQK